MISFMQHLCCAHLLLPPVCCPTRLLPSPVSCLCPHPSVAPPDCCPHPVCCSPLSATLTRLLPSPVCCPHPSAAPTHLLHSPVCCPHPSAALTHLLLPPSATLTRLLPSPVCCPHPSAAPTCLLHSPICSPTFCCPHLPDGLSHLLKAHVLSLLQDEFLIHVEDIDSTLTQLHHDNIWLGGRDRLTSHGNIHITGPQKIITTGLHDLNHMVVNTSINYGINCLGENRFMIWQKLS